MAKTAQPPTSALFSKILVKDEITGDWVEWDGRAEQVEDYEISDIDNSSDPKYYGFVRYDGYWYIMKETTALGTFRYTKGTTGYATAWTGRGDHTYGQYDAIF